MPQLIIELVNGKWTVNGKLYYELTEPERTHLDNFFKQFKNELENENI